jgi:hypothetical protein
MLPSYAAKFDRTADVLRGRRLRRRYIKRRKFNAIRGSGCLPRHPRSRSGDGEIKQKLSELERGGDRRRRVHHAIGDYCGEAMQTATSGALEGLAAGPQDALLSARNCAGFRVGPQ